MQRGVAVAVLAPAWSSGSPRGEYLAARNPHYLHARNRGEILRSAPHAAFATASMLHTVELPGSFAHVSPTFSRTPLCSQKISYKSPGCSSAPFLVGCGVGSTQRQGGSRPCDQATCSPVRSGTCGRTGHPEGPGEMASKYDPTQLNFPGQRKQSPACRCAFSVCTSCAQ